MATTKRPVFIIAAVAVMAFMLVRLPPQKNEALANESAPGAAPLADAPVMVKVEALVVNLNDDDETHFLKCALELEVGSGKDADRMTPRLGIVRNELILLLSSLTFADTRGEKAKVELLGRLTSRLNRALGGEMIRRAYFTDFVVQ